MAIQVADEGADGFSVVRVMGELAREDYPPFISEFQKLLARHSKLRILLDMSALEGWSADALWPELKFDAKHFSEIERLAAVGNKAWESGLMKMAKPFTSAEIRYFDVAESGAARDWLRKA